MTTFLNEPVETLPMVGDKYAEKLAKLGIKTIADLLNHYPFRYDDLSLSSTVDSLKVGETVTLTGTIVSIQSIRTRSGKTLQKAVFADETGSLEVTWFNQPFLVKAFHQKPEVSLSGKVTEYRGKLSLSAPQYEFTAGSNLSTQNLGAIHTGRIVPVYHETAGISSKWLRSRISRVLKHPGLIPDWLPEEIKTAEGLISLNQALKEIHFPSETDLLNQAIRRLSFDELFLLQLASQARKFSWHSKTPGHRLTVDPATMQQFISSLPFTLTGAQKQAINDIVSDLTKPHPMNRLLQGDVGSGKTVVAAASMYISAKNNLPSVLMAPTEVLALQHAGSIKSILEPLGLSVSVQTKSQKDRVEKADVYIGTHALLHRHLPQNLGVVIIDEQHRFGVEQRTQLLKQDILPNVLSMTATPIPRTVALTLYAELDMSVLDEMPQGRLPVTTWVVPQKKRRGAEDWLKKQIVTHDSQAFVVCPLIEDSPNPTLDQVKAAESEYEYLKQEIYPDLKIGLLHGKMKSAAKQAVITAFKNRELQLLVATPVIEVGIDIPNATVMVIEGAERFGLAALHQLRGRVGRGDKQSYCLLLQSPNSRPSVRLKHLEKTHSGFELAELDLKLRGPGEIYGTKQSGYVNLKIASLSDSRLIATTQNHAKTLISEDPELKQYPLLHTQLVSLLEKQAGAN